MLIKHTAVVAALALLMAGPLHARGTSFQKMDVDANGYISPEEAQINSDLSARWNELDADKNNLLDMSEFSAFEPAGGMGGDMMMDGQTPATPAE